MDKRYSVKSPSAWLWTCGLSIQKVRKGIASGAFPRDWLVCELGCAEKAVPISQFEELITGEQKRRESQRETQTPPPPPPPRSNASSFVLFTCVRCAGTVRIVTSNVTDGRVGFTCGRCKQPYFISAAQSDGTAFLIMPDITKWSSAQSKRGEPALPIEVRNALALFAISHAPTTGGIKAAYRDLMAKYHPDKVNHLGDELKKLAEQKSKEINSAYRVLCDFYECT